APGGEVPVDPVVDLARAGDPRGCARDGVSHDDRRVSVLGRRAYPSVGGVHGFLRRVVGVGHCATAPNVHRSQTVFGHPRHPEGGLRMYPQAELNALAERKAALLARITVERGECALQISQALKPVEWLTQAYSKWRAIS